MLRLLLPVLLGGCLHAKELRVVTWNIAHGEAIDRIADVLGRESADLVFLQEVDQHCRRSGFRDVAAELASRLGMNVTFMAAFEELGQSGDDRSRALQGQAILYREPLAGSSAVRFVRQDGYWKPRGFLPSWSFLQRRRGGRVAQFTHVNLGGTRVLVVNVHLESQTRDFGRVSRAQVGELLRQLRTVPPNMPVILAGDFNSFYNPGGFLRRLRAEGFRSALSQPTRTHRIRGALDWIFVRGGLDVVSARVIRGSGASDHDPVAAAIQYSAKQNTVFEPSGESPYSPFSSDSYTSKR